VSASLPQHRDLYLTFDDGPDPRWTPRVLDVLAQAHATATFFMIGEHARQHSSLVRRVAAEGHAIGNHTFTHAHPWTLSGGRAAQEVEEGAAALADILGAMPKWFRPPHGVQRRAMLEAARESAETLVMWDVSAIDWGWLGTTPRIAKRLARARTGDIILMHDGANRHNRPEQLLAALPQFL
jgi:peptidoglycan-N-acetylglucosamine deacetylase